MSISEMKAELKDRFDNPMDLRHFVSDVDDLYIATLLPASSGIIPGGQFKVWGGLMLFVLVDGWQLVVGGLLMSFARDVSSSVVFLHEGMIEEQGEPQQMFKNPNSDRFRQFLSRTMQ